LNGREAPAGGGLWTPGLGARSLQGPGLTGKDSRGVLMRDTCRQVGVQVFEHMCEGRGGVGRERQVLGDVRKT
jgi:hypothetical protein